MHKTRKLSTVTAFVAVFAVALAGMAWADNLVNDGDLLTADAQSLNFGDVRAGAEVTAPAEHWVTKQGPTSAWSNFFANSATVTFTVVSASSGLSAEMDDDPSTVTLPSNWRTSTNGTASAKVSSTVTLVAPAATGAFSGTVTYNASAPFGTDGTTSRTETLNVSANVINCAPPATEPTVNHTLSPGSPNGTNGWYRSAVSINWVITGEPAPALTGCASGPFSADGDYSESCTAVNSAGQASDTAVFKIDQTAPTVAFTSATAGVGNGPNAADWFKAPVTATFTATDNLSGFNAARTLTTTGAANSGSNEGSDVVIQSPVFTDWAGNTAAAGTASQSFKIDLSDPYNVAFVGGPDADASYVFGSIPAAPTCTADDAVSGVAGCVVTGYSNAVGTHTMTATATDNAGRTATAQRSYTVDPWTLSSFGQPVTPTANGAAGDDIKWNVMKSGRAVPLKFTIFAGATELTSTNAVKSFKAHNVGCNGAAGSGGLDLIGDNDTNAGNTTLRFDTDERQFIQNWKTPKVNADTCYRVVVETQDGNETQAYFRLTR